MGREHQRSGGAAGQYQVRLTVDGQSADAAAVVRRHPLRSATDADLKEQFDLAIQIRDKVSEANNAVIRDPRDQAAGRRAAEEVAGRAAQDAGERLTASLSAVEEAIYQVRNQSGQDPLNFPIKINNRLASLLRVVNSGDGKPIAAPHPIFKDLTAELKVQTDRLQQVLASDLTAFNAKPSAPAWRPLRSQPDETNADGCCLPSLPALRAGRRRAQQEQKKIDEYKMITYQAVLVDERPDWTDRRRTETQPVVHRAPQLHPGTADDRTRGHRGG